MKRFDGNDGGLVLLDECSQVATVRDQGFRELVACFDRAITNEDDDVKQVALVKPGDLGEALDVLVVLPEGVLERMFFSVNRLRPLGSVGASKDPAFHVLGLDDKNAEGREYDVVDLRCPTFMVGNEDVVDDMVNGFVETLGEIQRHNPFAKLAFEPRQVHGYGNEPQYDCPCKQRFKQGGLGGRCGGKEGYIRRVVTCLEGKWDRR